jgi:hypothetical protein
VQTSLAPRSSQKLAFKFFGPYKILARVGEVAYRLELPASSKIHNVVHVSQLKRHLPATVPVSDDPAPLCLDEFALLQPTEVMARKQIKRGGSMISRVLVRWLGLPATTITWEDEAALQQQFPVILACGQASTQGEGGGGECHAPAHASSAQVLSRAAQAHHHGNNNSGVNVIYLSRHQGKGKRVNRIIVSFHRSSA